MHLDIKLTEQTYAHNIYGQGELKVVLYSDSSAPR